jgi:putative nucleotidyltransferase with HDIG domain
MFKRRQQKPGALKAADETSQLYQVLARANHIANTTELDELLSQMLDLIIQVCGANTGTMYLLDHDAQELIFKVVQGELGNQELIGQRIKVTEGVVGACIQETETIVVNNLSNDKRWYGHIHENKDELCNTIAFPLLLRGGPIGAVQVFNFHQAPIQLIQLLGNRMASEYEKTMLLQKSQQHSERLQALIDLVRKISSTLDRDQILNLIIDQVRDLLKAEASSLFLLDDDSKDLVLYLSRDVHQTSLPPLHMPSDTGIIGHVIKTGEAIYLNDVEQDERHYDGIDQASGIQTKSLLAVPLRVPNVVLGRERGTSEARIIGGVEAINKIGEDFNENDIQLVSTFAEQAATVLHIADLYSNADELFLNTIESLVAAIDAKDPYTEGHSQRVSGYSVAIATEAGLPPEMRHQIRIGALLHDIGKIGVPDNILTKDGRLTDEEFSEIKKHPTIGANIIRQVRHLQEELPALEQHHERIDGKGYPKGLPGDEISTIARIVAVADVFDAITSDRPYRPAIDIEEALDIMRMESGDHLDPKFVDAFILLYTKGKIRPGKSSK